MTTLDRLFMLACCLFAYLAYVNGVEAHRHAHELGCAVNRASLCVFHEEPVK